MWMRDALAVLERNGVALGNPDSTLTPVLA
jgi:hypothetical protein